MMFQKSIKIFLFIILIIFGYNSVSAQCPQFFDSQGNLSNTPQWISCFGADFNLNVIPDVNIGNYSIDWGDGSLNTNGNGWLANTAVQHNYTATVANYNITITLPDVPCVITGLVILEEPSNASIQIPFGGLTSTCAPGSLDFTNSSTDVSVNTVFTWNFGDGSPIQTFNSTNAGQTISHTYLQGTVNCVTDVTLTAENFCNTLQGGQSVATFNPIRIWDIDDAQISASATLLCYPDTAVTLQNTTDRNCEAQGNIAQRYEYWNLGDYWGLGYDSIINWTAWPPALPLNMEYPGIGSYNAMLVDSSFCGLDTAYITIQIVPPPVANLGVSKDTICEGENVVFSNLSGGGANSYFWNFGDGTGWVNAGGGAVNHTYSFTGDYTIQIAVFIDGGTASCTDTSSIPLHVLPSPTANFNFDNNNGCDSLTVNFTDFSSANAVTWFWDFGNGDTSSLEVPPIQFYNSPGNYDVQLDVASINGCSNSINQTINIYQSPVPLFSPTSVCQNLDATFTDQSTSSVGDAIINWNWDFGDGNFSAQQNPNHIYTTAGTVDIILDINTAFCSASDTVTITIETEPTANFTPSNTVGCSPLGVSFANNSSASAANFTWDFGDGNTSTATNPIHTYQNNYGVDTTFTVTLIAQTLFGCADTIIQQISVFPNPSAAFTNDGLLDCAPLNVNFTNNSNGAVSYSWNFGDGSPIDNSVNPTHVFNNASQFIDNNIVTLIAFSANGCTDTIIDSVTVYPEPQFGFSTNPDSGCSPVNVIFPSVIGAVQYQWDFGDGSFGSGPTPNHTYINATTNNVIYPIQLIATSPFNCVDTSYGQVLVFPNPLAQFSVDAISGCQPLPINLTNSSTGGSFYHWDMGDATNFSTLTTNFSHTYTNTTGGQQNFVVELIAETDRGCTDTATQNITVYPEVISNFSSDTIGCSPYNVLFNNLSTGALNYEWNFGDATPLSNAINPSHQFTNTTLVDTIYTVRLIVESVFGCYDTSYRAVRVHPDIIAQFSTNTTGGCHPLPVSYTNTTIGGALYGWDMGDGTTFDTLDLTFDHIYTNTTGIQQNPTVQLFAESIYGCRDTATQNITVYPEVISNFSSDTIGCSPYNVLFNNLSTGALNYEWNFGDATPLSNAINPSHQFTNTTLVDTIYTVRLIVESVFGCYDTSYRAVRVHPDIIAQFSTNTTGGCHPLPVSYTNTTIGGALYGWDMGDGTTFDTLDLTFDHIYTNTTGIQQNPTVQLFAESIYGCRDTATQNITVYPNITAIFEYDTAGCSPFNVNFLDLSVGGLNYTWDFGDGSPIENTQHPNHEYINTTANDVNFTATLIIESVFGCFDTVQNIITVFATPDVAFTPTPLTQTYPNATVSFTNNSFIGPWLYSWDFGDNNFSSTQNPPNHTYSTWGTYNIQLVANSPNCADTTTQSITIIPPIPIANFQGPATGCRPLSVQFTNFSSYGNTYLWDFGDGGVSTQFEPEYTFYNPGTYTVTLTVIGDGGQDVQVKQQIIEVYQNPSAFFTASPTTVFIPNEPVLFFNLSNFANTYLWDFGDGNTSNEEFPEHTYIQQGVYDIMLVASTQNNCRDTFVLDAGVEALTKGDISIPNAFTPNPNGGNGGLFTNQDTDNDVFHPIVVGADEYELNIFNKWGELIFISTDVNIGWDGYYRGDLSKQDVYIYKVEVRFIDGRTDSFVGDVTLLR
ncbi:MAG: PKD domain-containing protein [Vicingaceae bacterium]